MKSKVMRIQSFSKEFFIISEEVAGGRTLRFRFREKGEAFGLRMKFYNFRTAAGRQGLEIAEKAEKVFIQILQTPEGEWEAVFSPGQLEIGEILRKQLEAQGIQGIEEYEPNLGMKMVGQADEGEVEQEPCQVGPDPKSSIDRAIDSFFKGQ